MGWGVSQAPLSQITLITMIMMIVMEMIMIVAAVTGIEFLLQIVDALTEPTLTSQLKNVFHVVKAANYAQTAPSACHAVLVIQRSILSAGKYAAMGDGSLFLAMTEIILMETAAQQIARLSLGILARAARLPPQTLAPI